VEDRLRAIAGRRESWTPFVERLRTVLAAMDDGYQRAAAAYGFHCRGCEDSCCRTHFRHHTLLELLHLRDGLEKLPAGRRMIFRRRAVALCRQIDEREAAPAPILCPLNEADLCGLYDHRPMICRLHGLPHELHPVGRPASFGPGCESFAKHCGDRPYRPFDRTPYYGQMARLEGDLRQAYGFSGRIALSVAEMVVLLESG
jgi:Fe-S-cluster containining protein